MKTQIISIAFISIQPSTIGVVITTSVFAMYYIAKTKIDVVDKAHQGSWRQFFKSMIQRDKTRKNVK